MTSWPELTVAAVATCLLLAGCAGDGQPPGNVRGGGSISVGASPLPETLDPALASDPLALQVLWNVYTPPLTYRHADGAEGTELIPGLARELPEMSEDGIIYEFTLRRGLAYSDGTPVRASDFERAVERARRLGSAFAGLYAGISSIHADDRSGRVLVTLKQPDAAFAHVLALPASAPVPPGTRAEDLSHNPPPGVGAYEIEGVRPGRRWRLGRVGGFDIPDLPQGYVDELTIEDRGDAESQLRAVIVGTLDLMQELPPTERLPEIRSQYSDRYEERPTASAVFLALDTSTPPLDDPRVRQAVSMSVDGPTLQRLYAGLLEPGCNLLPSSVQGHETLNPCPYGERTEPPDLLRAHELVENAGQRGARVTILARHGETPAAVARYLATTLRKLGLVADFELTAEGVELPRGPAASIVVTVLAPPVAHPAAYLRRLAGGVADPELDPALQRLLAEPVPEEALDDWAAVDRRMVEEAYAAPLGSERLPTFLSERVDARACPAGHPVFGNDLARLCLK